MENSFKRRLTNYSYVLSVSFPPSSWNILGRHFQPSPSGVPLIRFSAFFNPTGPYLNAFCNIRSLSAFPFSGAFKINTYIAQSWNTFLIKRSKWFGLILNP